MKVWSRSASAFALLSALPLCAQEIDGDRPKVLPTTPAARAERDRAEAATLFGLGNIHQKKNRLIEALRCFEEACKLDPDAVAPRKALVPIYLAIDRLDDAFTTAKRVVELDPADWETGRLLAAQLRAQGERTEAVTALQKALASPRLKDKLDAQPQLWVDLATLQEERSRWEDAAAALTKLVELLDHPAPLIEAGLFPAEEAGANAAESYERLGSAWLQAGKLSEAIQAFETARRRDAARAPRMSLRLAELHDKAGRTREALGRLEEYLASRPAGTEAYEMQLRLLKKLGREEQALASLQNAVTADPHNTSLALLLAREYRLAHRSADAEKLYNNLLQHGPGADVYRGLFALYKEQGEAGADRALRQLDQTVAAANLGRDQKDPKPTDERTVARAEEQAANGRAMLAALREDAPLVRALLESASRTLFHPNSPLRPTTLHAQTRLLLAALAQRTRQLAAAEELYRTFFTDDTKGGLAEHEAYTGLISVLLRQRKFTDAIAICEQGLAKTEEVNRLVFYDALASAHLGLGHTKEALSAAEEAEKLADPKNRLYCQRRRVSILSEAGRHAEAVAACRAMLKEYTQPGEIRDVRAALSSVYSTGGEAEKSEEQLRLILADDPDDVTANNNLGYQMADRNVNLEESEKLIRKAIDLDKRQRGTGNGLSLDADGENATYLDSLGWVLFRRGDLKGARRELEKACTLPDGDDDPVVWDHLGDVLFRLGEKSHAADTWHKALELFDAGVRRKDARYGEIQQKLKQTTP